mgnify:CR=1 FL=1
MNPDSPENTKMTWTTLDSKLNLIQRCDKLTRKCREKCFITCTKLQSRYINITYGDDRFFSRWPNCNSSINFKRDYHRTSVICRVFETYLFPIVVKSIFKTGLHQVEQYHSQSTYLCSNCRGNFSAVNRRKKGKYCSKESYFEIFSSNQYWQSIVIGPFCWITVKETIGFKWNTLKVNEGENSA